MYEGAYITYITSASIGKNRDSFCLTFKNKLLSSLGVPRLGVPLASNLHQEKIEKSSVMEAKTVKQKLCTKKTDD